MVGVTCQGASHIFQASSGGTEHSPDNLFFNCRVFLSFRLWLCTLILFIWEEQEEEGEGLWASCWRHSRMIS